MIGDILFPWVMLSVSGACFPITVIKILISGDLNPLSSWSAFNNAWFATVWSYIGPIAKDVGAPKVIPLLQGRVQAGKVHETVVSQPLRGTVLEVGAGSGLWLDVIKKAIEEGGKTGSSGGAKGGPTTKIYGVEPNHISAATLKQRVKEMDMEDVYEVVPVGVEDLGNSTAWGGKIEPESVDAIITVQCLCSIPEPEKNVALLYKYLKKGGHWYVFEHVRNDHTPQLNGIQRFTDIFWSRMMGGCSLCRPTAETLSNAGEWDKIDLVQPAEETPYEMICHVVGTLTK